MVFLLDGDGGRNAIDGIDVGLVHAVEELPDIGGERLDVAPLAFGVERVKGERRFSGAGRAGDDGELTEGDFEVESLEVVLAAAFERDGWRLGRCRHARKLAGIFNRASFSVGHD